VKIEADNPSFSYASLGVKSTGASSEATPGSIEIRCALMTGIRCLCQTDCTTNSSNPEAIHMAMKQNRRRVSGSDGLIQSMCYLNEPTNDYPQNTGYRMSWGKAMAGNNAVNSRTLGGYFIARVKRPL
jgi:hypothetical protein